MNDKKLKTVPLNKIKISDQFWDRYIHLVKNVLIPYQWDILNDRLPDVETSHCIENFKIAAGESDGDFEGAVFQDTDVAKWLIHWRRSRMNICLILQIKRLTL